MEDVINAQEKALRRGLPDQLDFRRRMRPAKPAIRPVSSIAPIPPSPGTGVGVTGAVRTSVLTKEAVLPLAAVTSVTGAGRLVLQV
jgi:hypothetical protein